VCLVISVYARLLTALIVRSMSALLAVTFVSRIFFADMRAALGVGATLLFGTHGPSWNQSVLSRPSPMQLLSVVSPA